MGQIKLFCLVVVLMSLGILSLVSSHGHGHAHGHSHEEPSFKYSRKANEAVEPEHHDHHGHGHGHGHSHDHQEHSHDHHGHSHDHHGHSHDHHGHSHDHHGHSHDGGSPSDNKKHRDDWDNFEKANAKLGSTGSLWLKAIGATALISVAPIFILVAIPLDNMHEHQQFLKVLLSFASGGLLGDAFLHLIPHAIAPHSHTDDSGHQHSHGSSSSEHGHSHTYEGAPQDLVSVGLWVLAGIMAFLMVEKFVYFLKGEHGHSHGPPPKPKKEEKNDSPKDKDSPKKQEASPKKQDSPKKSKKKESDNEDSSEKEKEKSALKKDSSSEHSDIKVAGYLNLAADFAHNFTDGLAIGASFLAGEGVGITTTVTIFFHEIPHEIGDFAILIQSGCSKKKAMLLQFSTAIGAMLGTICSLSMKGIDDAATMWILPFTAGGFIYIATVSVIPELLQDSKLGQSIKEILAMVVGVAMMVVIAQYE